MPKLPNTLQIRKDDGEFANIEERAKDGKRFVNNRKKPRRTGGVVEAGGGSSNHVGITERLDSVVKGQKYSQEGLQHGSLWSMWTLV